MALKEQFSSRWGLILASLGMAVGAGNLWRFPRLAGQYGGSFLLLWIIFLLLWSVPILLAEFAIGKEHKRGVIASFGSMAGKNYVWMGFFIAFCTLAITFYYSVVTSWGLSYLGLSFQNLWNTWMGEPGLAEKLRADPALMETYWAEISNKSITTVILHIFSIILAGIFLSRGIQKGWELANKILIPSLLVLLVFVAAVALSMKGGALGLEYMFNIKPELFSDPKVWLEALSQSAWSTGAGWGLIMTISSYSRKGEDVSLNIFISGFGNNTASLLAGFAILPAVFALAGNEAEAIGYLQGGNQALTFNIIPRLFTQVSGGAYLSVIFFTAFFLAAFSSLLAMIELFIRVIGDLGISRKNAVMIAAGCCMIFGLPSAWSLDFFNNQDWVWGIGLVISGLFIVFIVLKEGAKKFKAKYIDKDSDFKVNTQYFVIMMGVNIVLGFVLIYWWMSRGYAEYPWFDAQGNWNVWDVYSNASIITQWGLVLLVGILLNKVLYKAFIKDQSS